MYFMTGFWYMGYHNMTKTADLQQTLYHSIFCFREIQVRRKEKGERKKEKAQKVRTNINKRNE